MFFTPKEATPDLPGHCAITGQPTDPVGFVHTGNEIKGWDPMIQVSVSGLKILNEEIPAKDRPFVPVERFHELEQENRMLEQENAELRRFAERAQAEAAEQAKVVEAIDVIASAGFVKRNKAGRKPTNQKAAA
jgi:hypothetical protein